MRRLKSYSYRRKFPNIDLILSAGDLEASFVSFLVTVLGNKQCFYVRGNHDITYDEEPPLGENIDGRLVEYKGIRILGLGGSMQCGAGGVQYTERQMCWKIFKLRLFSIWRKRGLDIVLAHAPPRRIHDAQDPYHTGFWSFRKLIERYQPQYFIHGHSHVNEEYKGGRTTPFQGTKVVQVDGYCILDIKPRRQIIKGC